MKYLQFYLVSLTVIAIDQAVKLAVHFNMVKGTAGQIPVIGDLFKLHYLTNPGMAFGMELGLANGKLYLTLFRLLAMVGIGYYMYLLVEKKVHKGLIVCVALILGGAVGNVIDSALYGVLLDNAPYDAVTPWFHGEVVDMFYIDIWEGYLPGWLPFIGGAHVALWPVFNIADASIFIGVAIILIFQKRFFEEKKKAVENSDSQQSELGEPETVSVRSDYTDQQLPSQ
ncbi:MAG: lipoprotein signal peptidase [Cyclobacteriaceae bacterium]